MQRNAKNDAAEPDNIFHGRQRSGITADRKHAKAFGHGSKQNQMAIDRKKHQARHNPQEAADQRCLSRILRINKRRERNTHLQTNQVARHFDGGEDQAQGEAHCQADADLLGQ